MTNYVLAPHFRGTSAGTPPFQTVWIQVCEEDDILRPQTVREVSNLN